MCLLRLLLWFQSTKEKMCFRRNHSKQIIHIFIYLFLNWFISFFAPSFFYRPFKLLFLGFLSFLPSLVPSFISSFKHLFLHLAHSVHFCSSLSCAVPYSFCPLFNRSFYCLFLPSLLLYLFQFLFRTLSNHPLHVFHSINLPNPSVLYIIVILSVIHLLRHSSRVPGLI